MARRLLALTALAVILTVAATLLYRVYVHHQQSQPYESESSVVVRIGVPLSENLSSRLS